MAGPSGVPWAYSDWNDQSLFPDASTARLKRLDLHIKEVADAISCGGYQTRGRYVNIQDLEHYYALLQNERKVEADRTGLATGQRLGWTKGRAIL